MLALRDRHRGELRAGRAVGVEMHARLERARGAGRGQAVVIEGAGVFAARAHRRVAAELAALGARRIAVEQRDGLAHAGRDQHRGVLHQRAGREPADVEVRADHRVDAEHLAHAHEADIARALHDQPVDIGLLQPAVVERVAERLDRERVGVAVRERALRRSADAGDHGAVLHLPHACQVGCHLLFAQFARINPLLCASAPPLVTRQVSAPATCAVEVPRICRTPSRMRLRPCR